MSNKHHHSKLPINNSEVYFTTTSMEKHKGCFIEKENMFLVQSDDETNEDFYFPAQVLNWAYIIKK